MNKKVRQEVLNLSQSIFEDEDYNKVLLLLNTNRLNQLRLFVNEKLELMEIVFHLNKDDEVLRTQIELCDKLENIVIDAFLEVA
tara:strand:+ start:2896 stop:3147 length:252 start_codon:yes stop_codon:yes gene_type:complete